MNKKYLLIALSSIIFSTQVLAETIYDINGNIINLDIFYNMSSYEVNNNEDEYIAPEEDEFNPYAKGFVAEYIHELHVSMVEIEGVTLCAGPEPELDRTITTNCNGQIGKIGPKMMDGTSFGITVISPDNAELTNDVMLRIYKKALEELPLSDLGKEAIQTGINNFKANNNRSLHLNNASTRIINRLEAGAPRARIPRGNYQASSWHSVSLKANTSTTYRLTSNLKINGKSNNGFDEEYVRKGKVWNKSHIVKLTAYYGGRGQYISSASTNVKGGSEIGRTSSQGSIIVY